MSHASKRDRLVCLLAVMFFAAGLYRIGAASADDETGKSAASTQTFFRVQQIDGRWWFISPEGKPMLSLGVCHITFQGDAVRGGGGSPYRAAAEKKYGTIEKWREATADRLTGWGFNTLGAWSDEAVARAGGGASLAYAPTVNMGSSFVAETGGGEAWLKGRFPDAFDPRFEASCRRTAEKLCSARKDDRALLGWFSDNELRWGPDWRNKDELLVSFLNLPKAAAGRAAAIRMLRERYATIADFNKAWKTSCESWAALEDVDKIVSPYSRTKAAVQNTEMEGRENPENSLRAAFVADCDLFVGLLAERYFRVTREATLAADPNHLVFGCRFAYVPPKPVLAAAAKYLDVISCNCYAKNPSSSMFQYMGLGKPLLIGEFAFRGKDSGLPNTQGAGPLVATQEERAAAFEKYVRIAIGCPEIIGYHWFQWSDEPKEGRFDGENSNYGLVTIDDEPYPLLTQKMLEVNRLAPQWHRNPE
jgi:hypothetical protein